MKNQACLIRIIYILATLIFSCNENKKKEYPLADSTNLSQNLNLKKKQNDTSGLLKNCDSLRRRSTIGLLQVKNVSRDSMGFFGFFDNYVTLNTYEIIFVYKGGLKKRKGLDGYDYIRPLFYKGCNDNFSNFECYAFVLPMRDPEKQDDVDAMNIDFPVVVKAYKRIKNDKWQFLRTSKIKDYDEYTKLQFKTIYGIYN